MADWDEDGPRLIENLQRVLRDARDRARSRAAPTVEFARVWHREILDGLAAPDPAWVGAFRGEPGLEAIGVRVGSHPGVPPGDVESELQTFEARLRRAVEYLDQRISPGSFPGADEFDAVIEVCAWAHSEWVRIHPFANGNGRTARLWANYLAMRYGLPPFVRLRPRPDGRYGAAAARAMLGDHGPTVEVFREMLAEVLDPPIRS